MENLEGKKVLITISHSPYSTDICKEALRVSLGMSLSLMEISVKTVFTGDGVYFGLKEINNSEYIKYIRNFNAMGMELILEEESVNDRKIKGEFISQEFKTVAGNEIFKMIKEADHVIAF